MIGRLPLAQGRPYKPRLERQTVKLIGILVIGTAACTSAVAQRQEEQRILQKESSPSELFRKGEASASVGDMTRAEQYYVAALKAGGDPKQIVQRLLVVCAADQRYPAALEYAEQYLHRHPLDIEVKFAAGSLYAALGELSRARALLSEVVTARPEWPEAHYALASVLRDQGDALDAADVHDLTYLRLRPEGPLAERARARLTRTLP